MRLRRTPTLVVAAAVLVGGLTAVAPPGSAGASAAPSPAVSALYTLTKPLCSAPADPTEMRCYGLKRVRVARGTRGAQVVRPAAARGPAGGYTPKDLATAYGYTPTYPRPWQTVGIVLWHDAPNVLGDLNAFDRHYGMRSETARSFRKVNQAGRATPLPPRDPGTAGEIALDTQAVRAVCTTCRILLVEADGPYDRDLAAAENTAVRLGADIVTNSYGTPESRLPAAVTSAYHHPGVAIVASTGDEGWFGWDYANNPDDYGDGAASFPATSPDVLAVGGTTLQLDATGHRRSETVWNNDGPHDGVGSARKQAMGASGGGCSGLNGAQPWQTHLTGYLQAGCHGHRLAADVSMVADPETGFDVYDSYGSGGWVTVGGTSLSAPLVAGMWALAGGPQGARSPADAVYGNAAAYPARRFDVTAGGTGYCGTDAVGPCTTAVRNSAQLTGNPNKLGLGLVDCTFPRTSSEAVPGSASTECNAGVGYDGPSGVGTPRSVTLFSRTEPTVLPSPARATPRRATTFHARVSEPLPGTAATSLTWSWGDRQTTVTRAGSARHTYTRKGRYTLTLITQDSRFQTVVTNQVVTVR